MTPEEFIAKWQASSLNERSSAQQHFIDLCRLLDQPTPAEADPTGATYTFEKGGTTAMGGRGYADVWKRGAFGWEYKGPDKDLLAAYYQLKKYADALENPPLLVTSDTKRIEIHTNWTNTVKVVHRLGLQDLADPKKRELLRWVFAEPEKLRPGVTRVMVTTQAAERFSEIAHRLQSRGNAPQAVAHFLNRMIFCMFAEDVNLLPNQVFNRLLSASVQHPEAFENYARELFASMAKGGTAAFEVIPWFNGGLFDDAATLPLEKGDIEILLQCADLDWTEIEPSIFGTLFERGLDPDKRSEQGAHYTDPDTIMRIVHPVVLAPWERAWDVERSALTALIEKSKRKVSEAAMQRYRKFLERLHQFRVLDPSCGSGNFLYLALRGLKDLEKRVHLEAEEIGLPREFPRVGPEAVMGLEVNPYAAELARVTVWIGEIQWMLANGFGFSRNPVLRPLDQIACCDALLNDDGTPTEWPTANAIVGNPPFLGSQSISSALPEAYVESLRHAYRGFVSAGADLCSYWLHKARQAIAEGKAEAVGLVATSTIRHGKNRELMDSIVKDVTITDAWSDLPWVNDGAAVRVSIICFAKEARTAPQLDGACVAGIRSDLTAVAAEGDFDATAIAPLAENAGVCFQGPVLVGEFDVDGAKARAWLQAPLNVNGRKNADVLRPLINGTDIVRRPRDRWVIDFALRDEAAASVYEAPFEHVVKHVKPVRATNKDRTRREKWWLHGRTGDDFRKATESLSGYLATPRVAKHRLWVRLPAIAFPDTRLTLVARDDFCTFGILQSKVHEVWALATCSWHGVGNDPTYNTESCFETFPFPEGLSPKCASSSFAIDPRAIRIAEAAEDLDRQRENWLNPDDLVVRQPEVVEGYPSRMVPADASATLALKQRTLTALYNANPTWLQHANRRLDEAVAAAYGWQWPLEDREVLRRLFELNRGRR